MIEDNRIAAGRGAPQVPETCPVLRTDTPEPAKALPLLLIPVGMVGLWLMPARWGKRVAASGWPAAIVAFVSAMIIGGSLVIWTVVQGSPFSPPPPWMCWDQAQSWRPTATLSEEIRAPFGAVVLLAARPDVVYAYEHGVVALILGIVAVGVLLLSALIMPLAAAGEPLYRLWGRCVRTTLWSGTFAIPLGVLWLMAPLPLHLAGIDVVAVDQLFDRMQVVEPSPGTQHPENKVAAYVVAGGGILFICWWLLVLARSCRSYGGPPEGPAWQAARPRCRKCGYILSGLAMDGRCPECGTPVAKSMVGLDKAQEFTHWRAFKLSVRAAASRGRGEG